MPGRGQGVPDGAAATLPGGLALASDRVVLRVTLPRLDRLLVELPAQQRLRLGTAELEILDPCPRCVMITRRIDDAAPQDRAVLRHVVRQLDQTVGAYARVAVPGTFTVGDEVTLV